MTRFNGRPRTTSIGSVDPAKALQQAAEYDRDAEAGDTPFHSVDYVRSLAKEARAQGALFRSDLAELSTSAAPAPQKDERVTAARGLGESAYDSAVRREHTAAAMRSPGVPKKLVADRMTVDASFGTPAHQACHL